jgi:hypothetical protein
MHFKISIFFAIAALVHSLPALAEEVVPHIFQIESLTEITNNQSERTLFLFDIDDTLLDSFSLPGSKAWRKYIRDVRKDCHDVLTYELAQKYPLKTVESYTCAFVKELQDKGYVVCGLTSRERNAWYNMPQEGIDSLTVKQLLSLSVDLNTGTLENTYPDLAADPAYFCGIFFANIEPKGNYLSHLFENAFHLPEKVIFIDDKLYQVESVAHALTALEIPHECYHYTAIVKKEKAFNSLIANIQLFYFLKPDSQILSEQEAAHIAQEHPERDADYYLKQALENRCLH